MKRLGGHLIVGCCLLFAAVCVADNSSASFDAARAFSHLHALVEIGPRPPDSPGSSQAQAYIMDALARSGLDVREQPFVSHTPLGLKQMKNMVGVIPGPADSIIIIGAHYDTKLIKEFPFVGANDGASGVAVLLELARILPARKNPATIWLVFLDGEEALVRWSAADSLYGSRHMVSRLTESGEISKVRAMILLDMVGDAHLSLEVELLSTSWLRKLVWDKARKLGYTAYFTDNPESIQDDHVPFLKHGVPALDIIDFHYGPASRTNEYWHSPADSIENVSPRSLKIVGDVLLESLPDIIKRSTSELSHR
ncbi:M28 family peptidase [Candidatus Poribacteria bacterium]|nr:M28 family peptidase [Candidatus Poribacteria bacterium]